MFSMAKYKMYWQIYLNNFFGAWIKDTELRVSHPDVFKDRIKTLKQSNATYSF
jgi:hypothetical protein